MNGFSPASRRKQGKNDFDPAVDNPRDICPYEDEEYKQDWLDGWLETLAEYQKVKNSRRSKKNKVTCEHWHCCGGIPLTKQQNCGTCGDGYDD